jgi:hypothetical protein
MREFRKTMPRPRRGSKPVFGGPRADKGSLRCVNTPPHHMRSACQSHVCMIFGLVTSPEAPCGATWPSRHPPCRSGACIHSCTSREPVSAAGTNDILVQRVIDSAGKGLLLPAYLLTGLALRSDRVLHLVGVKNNLQLEHRAEDEIRRGSSNA